MNRIRKIIIRSFKSEVPAQFARITLSELGIDSRVKVHAFAPGREGRFRLIVDTKDASLAREILDQAEQYENLFLKRSSKRKKKNSVFGRIAELLSSPN